MKNNESYLSYLKYDHLNYKGLHLLKKKNMVISLPNIKSPEKVCEGCVNGKMHRLSFPKISYWAKALLELAHFDIFGPTKTPSLNGNRYFILFMDDYTRMMWIYLLKQKLEAFSTFLKFKSMVERESGYKLKILRTDHRVNSKIVVKMFGLRGNWGYNTLHNKRE